MRLANLQCFPTKCPVRRSPHLCQHEQTAHTLPLLRRGSRSPGTEAPKATEMRTLAHAARLIRVVIAAREALQMDYLAKLFSWTVYLKNRVSKALGSLFPVTHGRIRPFHQSVRDWLTDENFRDFGRDHLSRGCRGSNFTRMPRSKKRLLLSRWHVSTRHTALSFVSHSRNPNVPPER
jgi:hypothetical protein